MATQIQNKDKKQTKDGESNVEKFNPFKQNIDIELPSPGRKPKATDDKTSRSQIE